MRQKNMQYQQKKGSELSVITKAKELCSCIMTMTQKSPKQFCFSFVSRLQNISVDIIENIYRVNEAMLDAKHNAKRLDLQHNFFTLHTPSVLILYILV
jgi:hypothetical protein